MDIQQCKNERPNLSTKLNFFQFHVHLPFKIAQSLFFYPKFYFLSSFFSLSLSNHFIFRCSLHTRSARAIHSIRLYTLKVVNRIIQTTTSEEKTNNNNTYSVHILYYEEGSELEKENHKIWTRAESAGVSIKWWMLIGLTRIG